MLPLMVVPGVGSQIYRGLATVIIVGSSFCASPRARVQAHAREACVSLVFQAAFLEADESVDGAEHEVGAHWQRRVLSER